ncbi:MAG: VOC family protein [Gemmatimonadaceae bacterium]|nr:VOC family protein [Gemmatimonadaceae bacterium]
MPASIEVPERVRLPTDARIGRADLRVADLGRAIEFYRDLLGLELTAGRDGRTALAAEGGSELLTLREVPGIQRRPARPRSTGLYHVALLVPTRRDLGRALLGLNAAGYPLRGLSDHTVSESIYLDDPDGNGLEIYADRPRSSWQWNNGKVHITTDPMDVEGVIAAAEKTGDDSQWGGLPSSTVVGHIHFTVANLDASVGFYRDVVGLDEVIRMPTLSGVSAGGYHHHLNLNTWAGAGAPPDSDRVAGLDSWQLVVTDSVAREALARRLQPYSNGSAAASDPDGTALHVVV